MEAHPTMDRNTTDIVEGPCASSTANLTNTGRIFAFLFYLNRAFFSCPGLKCFNQKFGSKFVNQSMCKQGEFCVHVKCPIEKTDKAYKYYGNYLGKFQKIWQIPTTKINRKLTIYE